ncbi:unnamed protein product, partial [marine sediment metagenome]
DNNVLNDLNGVSGKVYKYEIASGEIKEEYSQ